MQNFCKQIHFPLANGLHAIYSTLYLGTVSLLAKWTIAIGFSEPPRDSFPDISGKAALRTEDEWHFDGTGHLEGVREICRPTYSSWLAQALGLNPVLCC